MSSARQMTFWVGASAAFVLLLWLLSEILLPFVAGMAIAYLLNPLADRIERLGRPSACGGAVIIGLTVLVFVILILLVAPILGGQLSSFIDNIPGYVTKLQTLITDPSRPWVQKLLGAGSRSGKRIERSGHARRRLAHDIPEIAVVGRPRADLAVLVDRGHPGRRLLSAL